MMSFSRLDKVSLIVFLLSTIGIMESIVTDPVNGQQEQPFWQYILREFIFKTISSPLPDDTLYKKIKDAPFYGGPLLPVTNNEDTLLSRGSVFRMPDEQWIFCQDDCEECGSCAKQQNPIVKWMLKRVKRRTSEDSPKWDLQLTVLPQSDIFFENSLISNNRSTPSENGLLPSFSADQDVEKPREKNDWFRNKIQSTDGPDSAGKEPGFDQEHWTKYRSRSVPRIKGHRSVRPVRRPGVLPFHHPQERVRDEADIRLIVGIDQYGEKHLVHMVPIPTPLENEEQLSHLQSRRESSQTVHSPRVMRTTQLDSNENAVYNELIDRILDSLTNHRNFIETFLFSDRLVSQISMEDVSPPQFYPGAVNQNDRFHRRNDNSRYSSVPSQRINDARPTNSEYQVDEQDQQNRRYTDMRRKVNRLAGPYQDQSSMIEYKPYETSSNDHQYDERSSAQTDTERRRRNSSIKITRPIARGNLTRVNDADSVFIVNRKPVSNLADRGAVNTQSEINQTDPRIQKFSEETTVRV